MRIHWDRYWLPEATDLRPGPKPRRATLQEILAALSSPDYGQAAVDGRARSGVYTPPWYGPSSSSMRSSTRG